MLTLNDGRSELWQWDTGRRVTVDVDCSQVHFSNKVFGRSIDVDVIDGSAIIPDILLQTDKDLSVWSFVGTAENGYTKISKVFKVNRRNKPADYVFTPLEQTTLSDLVERLDEIEKNQDPDAIKNAVEDYLEQNPVEAPVKSVNGITPDPSGKVTLPIPTKPSDIGAQPAGNYATKDEIPVVPAIPTTLPNPHKLTINGTSYDGSAEVEVNVEGGGRRYELLATVTTTEDVEMVEITECDDGTPLLAKELLIRTHIAAGTAKCNIWVGSTCYRWLKGADGIFRDIKQCTWYDSVQHINGIDTSKVDRWTKLIHHYKKDVGVMYEKWKSVAVSNTDVFEMYDGVGLKRLNSTYYAREEGFDHVYVKTNDVAKQPIPAGSKITVYGVRA